MLPSTAFTAVTLLEKVASPVEAIVCLIIPFVPNCKLVAVVEPSTVA